jgi:hypothetical protein
MSPVFSVCKLHRQYHGATNSFNIQDKIPFTAPGKKDFSSKIEPVFLFHSGRISVAAYPSDAGLKEGEGNASASVNS